MGLGRSQARRHQTVASLRAEAVDSTLWWDYQPGQAVMTIDGYPGVVTAVQDGPFPGNEEYEVTLDNEMGGGRYTSSQLTAKRDTTASTGHTAAEDYPELAQILVDRPDIAPNTVLASKVAQVEAHLDCNDPYCPDRGQPHSILDHVESFDDQLDKANHDHKADRSIREAFPKDHDGDWLLGLQHEGPSHLSSLDDARALLAEAAYNEGDPAKYTAPHPCPNCGSKTALESQDGTIKCETCGYESHHEPGGDGYPKQGSAMPIERPDRNPQHGATCKECGYSHRDAKPGDSCLLCDGQMSAHPEKYATLLDDPSRMLLVAATDPSFRWHITATWSDVRNKAKRIRSEGKVNIISVTGLTCVANVKGDHGVYETEIVSVPGTKQVGTWHCGCKWSAYSWGRNGVWKRYEGRMCSHAYALHLEMQSQGMFGGSVEEDQKAPQWLKPRTRVVIEYDKDDAKNVSRPAQPRKRDVGRTFSSLGQFEASPISSYVAQMTVEDIDPAEVVLALTAAGIDGQRAFQHIAGEDPDIEEEDRTGPCAHCGHAVSLHHNFGACTAIGCPCRGYKEKGSEGEREASKHKHHPTNVHPAWGYGLGVYGLCSQCAGGGCGYCGGTGQATGTDTGTGAADSGGGMSSTGQAWNEDPASDYPQVADSPSVPVHDHTNDENPAQMGFASDADPKDWGQQSPFSSLGAMDEAMFEVDDWTKASEIVAHATMDDEPEAALPQTDGTDGMDGSSPSGDTGNELDEQGDLSSLSSTASTSDILAAFQAKAKHLEGGGAAQQQATGDIAAQAAAFLATGVIPGAPGGGMGTTAMKTFSPEEQRDIIEEGRDVTAANLDRLDIAGTHYEALDALAQAEDSDDEWMMT